MFLSELRHAFRLVRRTPGVSLVAIVTLAIGLAANVTIFSVVSGVLLHPLPYRDPDRLFILWESTPKFPEMSVSYLDYADWVKGQHAFEELGASRSLGYTLTGLGAPELLKARMSSANFFRVLGVTPALGRSFADGEDQPGAAPVAIVSDLFWRERLHADPAAVGKSITLDGSAFTVVGVLPPRFRYYDEYPVWVTFARLDPLTREARGSHPGIYGVGRLRAGMTLAQARADLENVARNIPRTQPMVILPSMMGLQAEAVQDVCTTLWLLLGAVSFVLLIACANVANLMLARGTARSRELAVRAALGASRWALMRPLLYESAIIAVAGGGLGVILALWGVDLLAVLRPDSIPHTAVIALDGSVLAYSLGLTSLTALLCGLAPAIKASRTNLNDALKAAGSRGVVGAAHGRLRSALVVAEVAMALVLLVGAGLAVRTFQHLSKIDPGFRSDGLTTMQISLSPRRYPNAAARRAVFTELQRRFSALPGVDAAAISDGVPFFGASEQSFSIGASRDERFTVAYYGTPGLVRAIGGTLLSGREIGPDDDANHEKVCLIDEEMARTFFPGGNALGGVVDIGSIEKPDRMRVIGIVRPVLHYGLEGKVPARYQLYMALSQLPDEILPLIGSLRVSLRGPHPSALIPAARAAVAQLDPEMPISDVHTMNEQIADSVGGRRFAMLLLGVFALVALLLALVGLYAVMSYMVTQRHHEIGVRMALGAQPSDVERMIVRQGLTLVALGLAVGLATSLALTRVLGALVNGLSATDPLTYVTVAALLTAAAALASFIPARAATRVDPMVVLRYE